MGALDQAQAARLLRVHALLASGALAQATVQARQLAHDADHAADAHQVLAMCLVQNDDAVGAHTAFARALELAPGNGIISGNYARWLARDGRTEEAVRVLASATPSAALLSQMGILHLQMDAPQKARDAFIRATELQPDLIEAWHGLGSALQRLGTLESALAALRRATSIAPAYAPAWINQGAVLRLLGRFDAALECLQHAESLGHSTPALRNALIGLRQDMGQPAVALRDAQALVQDQPAFVPGHESLAHLLWQHGTTLDPALDPLAPFAAAARAQLQNLALQIAFVRALLEAQRADSALQWLTRLARHHPADPALDWLAADALERLGRLDEAGKRYAAAALHFGESRADFLNAHAAHGFRTGDVDFARHCAERALRRDAHNQEAWALLGTAWRLSGDAREFWLCDYERLIADIEIEPPPGYASLDAFLPALARVLERLHATAGEPRAQSVRGGSQTSGRLFGRDIAELDAAERALAATATRWIATLPHDPRHPFLARRQAAMRIVGAWSVRLRSAGWHAHHIHNAGWASSAFYVALPACIQADDRQHDGWLQFAQPMASLGLDLAPRRLLRPRPGHLVLFPSFFWHGTLPFSADEHRLTIAFDMQPAA